VLSVFLYGSAEAIRYRPYTNGNTPWYRTTPKVQPDSFPVNYPVADFGIDHNVIATENSLRTAEK
jgi:hypothetical protein